MRKHLKKRVLYFVEKWEPLMEVQANYVGVKRMKTKWGSCNVQKKRIWINAWLTHYSDDILEFIVVHELCHLKERYHNVRFYGFMDTYLPDWRKREDLLRKG